MIYIIIGVSGSGKTSVGTILSKTLSVPFYDGDDYHNNKNIQKMKNGLSLNDFDRQPWLNLLALKIKEWNSKGDAVLACSALKNDYRLVLSHNNKVTFIFLYGSYDLIYSRLLKRKNHFFTKEMLETQFSILEVPTKCIKISINQSIENINLLIHSTLDSRINEQE